MILVVGATGLLGGTITRKLLQEGKEVRILVRHNSPAEAMAKQGLATPAQTLIDAGAQPIYGEVSLSSETKASFSVSGSSARISLMASAFTCSGGIFIFIS